MRILKTTRLKRDQTGDSTSCQSKLHAGTGAHEVFEDDEHDGVDEIDELCREALTCFEESDLSGARERAMQAVQLDDEHPFPMFVLGLIAEHEGDIASARAMSELALRTAATNADAIGLRVQVHLHENEFDEAEQLLRFGIVHNPGDAELHEGLARIALARGRFDDAMHSAAAALRLDPTSIGASAVRAAAMEQTADRSSVLAVLRQSAQLFPDDPIALVELAAAEAENGGLERARRLLNRAHRLAPRDPQVRDVRMMVESVHANPILRPLPPLMRWVREFPGSIVGFVFALLLAALPLALVAEREPLTLIPISLMLGTWALTALYVWVMPAVASLQLSRVAATATYDELLEQLTDPTAVRVHVDEHALADTLSLLFAARRYRTARQLLASTADSCDMPACTEFALLQRRLRRPLFRLALLPLKVPGERRILIAAAAVLTVTAPIIDKTGWLPAPLAWLIASVCALAALVLMLVEQRPVSLLDDTMSRIGAMRDAHPDN